MTRKISELFDLLLTTANHVMALLCFFLAVSRYRDGQPWEFTAFLCVVSLLLARLK